MFQTQQLLKEDISANARKECQKMKGISKIVSNVNIILILLKPFELMFDSHSCLQVPRINRIPQLFKYPVEPKMHILLMYQKDSYNEQCIILRECREPPTRPLNMKRAKRTNGY